MHDRTSALQVAEPSPRDERQELIDGLADGRLRFHQLPAHYSAREKADLRRAALEQRTGVALENMGHYSLDDEKASRPR